MTAQLPSTVEETTAPDETISAPGQAWSLAEPAETKETLVASEGLQEAVSSQSETAGSVLDALSAASVTLGDTTISVLDVLLVVAVIVLVIGGAMLATRLFASLLKRATRLDATQQLLVQKISTILVWAAAFFIGVDLLGIDLTALAVFGGAFGLAIGFGLQKTFGNLISGILLLMDKSIKPGDVISVTDAAGEYLIPNENLMINQVVNWSYSSRDVRVRAPVGVSYDSDLQLVEELLYRAVEETDRILPAPKPRVNLMEFGDNSVNFEIRFWIRDPEGGLANIRSDVFKRIWQLFKENDIEIPYPQRDLHIRSGKQLDQLIEAISTK